MSIASELTALQTDITNARTAITTMGGTVTASGGSSQLATDIATIPTGGGTKYGTTLDNFIGDVDSNGVLQPPSETTFTLTGVTKVGNYALYYRCIRNNSITTAELSTITAISGNNGCASMFQDCTALTTADLSNLTTISGSYGCNQMFQGCTNLTTVNLTNLTTISGSYGFAKMFYGSGITTVDLHNLTTVNVMLAFSGTFQNCTRLQSVNLSGLTSIPYQGARELCYGCTALTSVDLSALQSITGSQALYQSFYGCTSLQTLSFPALKSNSFGTAKNQFDRMLFNVTGCTVHFPSNLQSVIGGWASVTAGFGGTNTTVLFDLPATT